MKIGQRYSFIIETDQKVDNYWIRTDPSPQCSQNRSVVDGRTGILRYQGAPSVNPTTTAQPNLNFSCTDEPSESLKPIVKWEVDRTPANNVTADTYEVGLQQSRGFLRWAIGEVPLWYDAFTLAIPMQNLNQV
jgi:Multicopper oxidase